MDRKSGLLPLALLGVIAGGALIPRLGPQPAPTSARSDQAQNPKSAAPDPLEGGVTFVEQLAKVLNVDISERALIKAAIDWIHEKPQSPAAREMARCFLDLDIGLTTQLDRLGDPTVPACGGGWAAFSAWSPPATVHRLVESAAGLPNARRAALEERVSVAASLRTAIAMLPGAKKNETVVDALAANARRRMAFLVVREAARRPEGFAGGIKFLVATVPDPVDSYAGWQFDPTVAAMADAAAAVDYKLVRFFFPDSQPVPLEAKDLARGTEHERYPAVVLFRRDRPAAGEKKTPHELLVLLLAYETPTSGVHPQAFAAALRTAVDWDDDRLDQQNDPLRVLAPTFSGSRESINAELERAPLHGRHIRIIAGYATSHGNIHVLEKREPDLPEEKQPVTFHATVHSSDILQEAIWDYMRTVVHPGIEREPVAWLVESNTVYGSTHVAPGRHPIELPFPMHISRLGVPDGAVTAPAAPQRFRPLAIGDEIAPTDQLPFFSPKTTNSYSELVLANILRTIKSERVGFVGIIATDARDKLFLAREITKEAPNVILFTTESDLLYSHPDYFVATAGMLIAAPYPMGVAVAQSTPRRFFPSTSTEGVYNAMIALLAYDARGNALSRSMLDYGAPDCPRDCQPSVWISVVGRDRPREVWRYDPATIRFESGMPIPNDYALKAQPNVLGSVEWMSVSDSARILMTVLTLLILAHALTLLYVVPPRKSKRRPLISWGKRAWYPPVGELTSYFGVASAALVPVAVLIGTTGWFWRGVSKVRAVAALALWAGSVVAVLLLAWVMVRCLFRLQKKRMKGNASVIFAVITGMVVCLALFLWRVTVIPELFVDRVANWSDGMSPAMAVVTTALAFYLWPGLELVRLRRGMPFRQPERRYLTTLLGDKGRSSTIFKGMIDRLQWANGSLLALPYEWLVALVVCMGGLVTFMFDPFLSPLVTVDGIWLGRFISIGTLALEMMIAVALAQFLFLWLRVDHLLDRVSALPLEGAFERIPTRFFPSGVIPRMPRLYELEFAVNLRGVKARELGRKFQREVQRDPELVFSSSKTWRVLLEAAADESEDVWKAWKGRRKATTETVQVVPLSASGDPLSLMLGAGGGVVTGWSHERRAGDAVDRKREEFVAIPFVFIMRSVLARMWDNLLFVAGAIVLLAVGQWGYRVQMKSVLEALLWVDVVAAVCIVLFVFVRMERDEILSHITSTTPGQISWDRDFLIKIVVYGLIPLAGLFATQFPNFSGTVVRWIEPVQKALP